MPGIIAIDGNSLMHRAFYALPQLTSPTGQPTGALMGFLSMLVKLWERKPEYLAVAFDMKGPTFRHFEYEQYKEGRRETPDELKSQFPVLKEVLCALGVSYYECPGFEADDILGVFARIGDELGMETTLVTGDRDALQLISDNVHVLMTKRGISETKEYDAAALFSDYGLLPEQIVDLKGLMGDSSDNIPGIPGVGEKTALKLLHEYGTIENLLANADKIPGKLGERVRENADLARLSRKLAVIDRNAPAQIDIECCRFVQPEPEKIRGIFAELGLKSLFARITGGQLGDAPAQEHKTMQEQAVEHEAATIAELRAAVEKISGAPVAAITLDGGLTIAASGQEQYRARFGGESLLDAGMDERNAAAVVSTLFSDGRELVAHDAKSLMTYFARNGVEPPEFAFDTMLSAYALDPSEKSDAASVAKKYGFGWQGAATVLALKPLLEADMRADGLTKLFRDIEMPLTRVLFDMEKTGFRVDAEMLRQLGAGYSERLAQLENEIYEMAGERFNIASPKQLGDVLFIKLGLPSGKKTKTGFSTDIEVLEALEFRHPIITSIIEHRKLSKLKSTYVEGLLNVIGADGRVHTTFNQTAAVTGRISSTEPNLQNIPVRAETGREIRRVFIPSREGWCIVSADYSQIELRVLAHISGDARMIAAFVNGEDIHTTTASEVFGVPPELVTPEMRSGAKAVNFGIVYGISEFGLARNLGISRAQAGEYINRYFERFKDVREYMNSIIEKGKRNGYVTTLFGRRRYLREFESRNYNVRQFGERVALNTPIQGTAADIIKLAMIAVHKELKARGLEAKLILQVHDELIVDAPESEREQVSNILKGCMENVAVLSVPLEATVRCGRNWYEAK